MSTYYGNTCVTPHIHGPKNLYLQPPPARSGTAALPTRLRQLIPREEFDYQTLLSYLQGYDYPRDKITDLLRKGVIIRVKKGLYVFGELYRRRPVSREVLANLMYGPSYISMEYALQHYGLIPEAVETITSVTCGRSRSFVTPLGSFTYRKIPIQAFCTGMDLLRPEEGQPFLMAIPEKALADKLVSDRGAGIRNEKELSSYLNESLRIPHGELAHLRSSRIAAIACSYRSRRVMLLSRVVECEHTNADGDT